MENIYAMLARVDFLDEIRENEKRKAAEQLQAEICAFVAHYGYASTDVRNLSLVEMEFLHEFMIDTLNNDLQYQEDEIDRYIDLCQ